MGNMLTDSVSKRTRSAFLDVYKRQEYEEDQTLKITYTGTISAKEIPAVEVTAQ